LLIYKIINITCFNIMVYNTFGDHVSTIYFWYIHLIILYHYIILLSIYLFIFLNKLCLFFIIQKDFFSLSLHTITVHNYIFLPTYIKCHFKFFWHILRKKYNTNQVYNFEQVISIYWVSTFVKKT